MIPAEVERFSLEVIVPPAGFIPVHIMTTFSISCSRLGSRLSWDKKMGVAIVHTSHNSKRLYELYQCINKCIWCTHFDWLLHGSVDEWTYRLVHGASSHLNTLPVDTDCMLSNRKSITSSNIIYGMPIVLCALCFGSNISW